MAWKIEFYPKAEKEFSKLAKPVQQLIRDYLRKRVSVAEYPRAFGKPLSGDKSGFWRYRVDKYRIICRIEDAKLVILVVRVAKRDIVYD